MQEGSVRDLGMGCSGGVPSKGAAEAAAYLEGYGIGCSGLEVIGTFLSRAGKGILQRIRET